VSVRRARLITRSPTLRISSSRRARSTRTKCDGATPRRGDDSARAAASAGAPGDRPGASAIALHGDAVRAPRADVASSSARRARTRRRSSRRGDARRGVEISPAPTAAPRPCRPDAARDQIGRRRRRCSASAAGRDAVAPVGAGAAERAPSEAPRHELRDARGQPRR
jgi:hypothetical protein